MLPCKGVYADISKTSLAGLDQSRAIEKVQDEYEHYKRGFSKDFPIPTEISCRLTNFISYVVDIFRLSLQHKATLGQNILRHGFLRPYHDLI